MNTFYVHVILTATIFVDNKGFDNMLSIRQYNTNIIIICIFCVHKQKNIKNN